MTLKQFPKKKWTTKGKTTTLKKVAKQVKHLVALEKSAIGYDNDTLGLTNLTTAGLVDYMFDNLGTTLIGEPQELASNTSIKCNYLNMDFRYSIFNGGILNTGTYTTLVSPRIRVIVFQDWANKQALPAVTDVLLTADVNSPYKQLNKARFQIKYDKTHVLNMHNSGASFYATEGQTHHAKIRFAKNRMIEYVAGAGVVADAQKGQVFTLWIVDRINAGTITAGSIAQFTFTSDLQFETA